MHLEFTIGESDEDGRISVEISEDKIFCHFALHTVITYHFFITFLFGVDSVSASVPVYA